ncbi:MAG: hydrogenase small subunit [Elusimicrobia bacterium]|nr:hydrogenase small subunit [Elusimicrobiota bacterium]
MPKEFSVIWFQGAACSGCAVSVLNSLSPTIKNVLLDELVPGKHINLLFMPVVMAASGKSAIDVIIDAEKNKSGEYILIVEGSIPKNDFGDVAEKSMEDSVEELSKNASAIISLGTCSAFGGIPKGKPNPTKSKSVQEFLNSKNIKIPIINIPGCPPHPDWFVGTVANILLFGIPQLDELSRPKLFYGKLIHENCERRPYFDKGKFAKKFSDEGCLFELGCKGPYTNADCPIRSWNSGVNWCIQNGSPCIGCVEPEFPDLEAMYKKTHWSEEK